VFGRTGQLLLEHRSTAQEGLNRFRLKIPDLPADLYLLQIQAGDWNATKRFLKQ
jgi:hypothetical protein